MKRPFSACKPSGHVAELLLQVGRDCPRRTRSRARSGRSARGARSPRRRRRWRGSIAAAGTRPGGISTTPSTTTMQQHGGDGRPVDLRPVGAEHVPNVATAGCKPNTKSTTIRARSPPPTKLPERPRRGRRSGLDNLAARDLRSASTVRYSGWCCWMYANPRPGDHALDEGGAEHVREQHGRHRNLESVRAVQRSTVRVEQAAAGTRARSPAASAATVMPT